jgi:hypothetical protein
LRRPHTPQDQAWTETLFGHAKGEWPHPVKIRDPGELDAELDRARAEYNTVNSDTPQSVCGTTTVSERTG